MTLIAAIARTASTLQRIMPLLAGCATAAAAMRQQRRTLDTLSSLDDRALQDIGLDRTMLLSVSINGAARIMDAAPLASRTLYDGE